MISDGIDTVTHFPITGIGPGNFLFYQRSKHYQENFLHDLPLNQFLQITIEGGILSLIIFLFWFFGVFRHAPSRWRWVMVAFILCFLVGTPLWLPEGIILFWLVIALGQGEFSLPQKLTGTTLAAVFLIIGLFISFNSIHFKALDPSEWQKDRNLLNSYGFWDADPGMEGVFRWTRRKCGYYFSGEEHTSPRIYCGAPLEQLPGKRQTVAVFWQGKRIKTLTFNENNSQMIELPQGESGWLEFLIDPVFNLKEMNLGPETRTLGVQLYFK